MKRKKKKQQYRTSSGIAPFICLAACITGFVMLSNYSLGATDSQADPIADQVIADYNPDYGKEVVLTKEEDMQPVVQVQEQLIVSDSMVNAVMKVESGGNACVPPKKGDKRNAPCKPLLSKSGAIGKMQLLPATAREMGINPYNSHQNVKGGKMYLSRLLEHYNDETLAFMAYNWGIGNVDRWLERGAKLSEVPKETKDYVSKVHVNYAVEKRLIAQN